MLVGPALGGVKDGDAQRDRLVSDPGKRGADQYRDAVPVSVDQLEGDRPDGAVIEQQW